MLMTIVSFFWSLIRRDSLRTTSLFDELRSRVFRLGSEDEADSTSDLREFWEEAHRQRSIRWLTGSHPVEVINRLDVHSEIDQVDAHILDVGVGNGVMARYLFNQKIKVSVLDVSFLALERVKGIVQDVYSDPARLPDEEFSLVMHHLVAQHMCDESLGHQVFHLVRSLRNDGIVAMQFRAPLGLNLSQSRDALVSAQAKGAILRRPEDLERLVCESGARVLDITPHEKWTDSSSQWWVIKFARSVFKPLPS